MHRFLLISLTVIVVVFAVPRSSAGILIDFEDGAAFGGDDAAISNQYTPLGVTFSLLAGKSANSAVLGLPTLELVGNSKADKNSAFVTNNGGGDDLARSGFANELGDYLLKTNQNVSKTGFVRLVLDFSQDVASIGGQIWDIDGGGSKSSEQWRVTAFDGNNAALSSIDSPLGTNYGKSSLDGLPWNWELSGANIRRVELEFIGTKQSGNGVGFDNFFVVPVPEPGMLLLIGLGGLLVLRRS